MTSAVAQIALVGFGTIGEAIVHLTESQSLADVVCILVRERRKQTIPPTINSIDELLGSRPDVVIECAGQDALAAHGEAILAAGFPLVAASVGALSDDRLHRRLLIAAEKGCSRLIIPTGGLAGTDTLGAAATVGLESVSYRGSGRPVWWSLDDDAPKQTLFKGTAREACRRFPKNANVAAAVSLMGIGFDATTVELVADPDLRIYRHEIFASGRFGNLHTRVDAEPIEAGKRSTHLIAGSLINSAQSAH